MWDRAVDLGLRVVRPLLSPSDREWIDAMRAEYEVVPRGGRRDFLAGCGWGAIRLIVSHWAGRAPLVVIGVAAGLFIPFLDRHGDPDTPCRLVALLLLCCSLLSVVRPREFLVWPLGVVLGLFAASALHSDAFLDRGDLSSVLALALVSAIAGHLVRRMLDVRWSGVVFP